MASYLAVIISPLTARENLIEVVCVSQAVGEARGEIEGIAKRRNRSEIDRLTLRLMGELSIESVRSPETSWATFSATEFRYGVNECSTLMSLLLSDR